jgi:hypothetical protein
MDQNDRRAIDDLFAKVQEAERQSPPRDAQAEAHIVDLLRRQPAAPYYLAQAVIVQEHALTALDQRVQELEAELARRPAAVAAAPAAQGGGFLGGLFGAQPRPAEAPMPQPQPQPQPRTGSVPAGGGLWNRSATRAAPAPAQAFGQPAMGQPGMGRPGMMGRPMAGGMPFGGGQRGGFLGGALGTAAAVAGGVLLGNAVAGMFSDGAAQAAPPAAPEPAPAPEPEPTAWEEPAADFGGEEEF